MTSAGKKTIRVVGIVLTILLLIVVAVKIFLPAEKIRDLALEQARAKLGREVSVGDVNVSLRGGLGVRLSDFVVPNPEGFSGEPLLTTSTLDLKLEIRPLLQGEIRVNRLVIDTPVLNLIRHEDGTNNFTFPAMTAENDPPESSDPSSPEKTPPPLSIAGLALNNGRITFLDQSAEPGGLQQLQISDLALNMALTDPSPDEFRADGNMSAGSITMTGPSNVPELNADMDFDITWRPSKSRLEVTRADIKILDLPLACSALITVGGESPQGNIHVVLTEQPLVKLAKFLPPELANKIPDHKNSGSVSSTMDLALTGNQASPFSAGGTLKVKEADLSLLQPFLPPKQKGRVQGQCDLEASFADLKGDPTLMSYDGVLTIRSLSFTESGLVDELEKLESVLKFDNDEFQIESCRAQFASGTFFLTGSLKDPFPYFLPPEMQKKTSVKTPHLAFDLRSAKLDVDRLLPAASPGGPKKSTAGKKTKRPAHTDLEFPGLSCNGTFAADSLIYMQVPLTNIVGKVGLEDRRLRIYDVKGDVYQGRVDGQIGIDLRNLNDPLYTGQYQAQAIEVNNFTARFADLKNILFGSCNMSGQFSTHGLDPEVIRNSLALESAAEVQQGRIITGGNVHQALNAVAAQAGQTLQNEQSLSDLATHIRVVDGRVELDELTTRLGQFGDFSFGGYYAFNGDLEYRGKVLLTQAQTNQMFNSGGLLGELSKLLGDQRPARLELPLLVSGTRSNPKVKLDFGSVVEDLQDRVVNVQGQRLEDEVKGKLTDLLEKWK